MLVSIGCIQALQRGAALENVIPRSCLFSVFALMDQLRQLKGKGRRESILAQLWASPPVIHVITTSLTYDFIYLFTALGLFLLKHKSDETRVGFLGRGVDFFFLFPRQVVCKLWSPKGAAALKIIIKKNRIQELV